MMVVIDLYPGKTPLFSSDESERPMEVVALVDDDHVFASVLKWGDRYFVYTENGGLYVETKPLEVEATAVDQSAEKQK